MREGWTRPLGRNGVSHDTPFSFLILNITYFLLSDILIFFITHTQTMSYINTQGMSLPSSSGKKITINHYSPMPVKEMKVFTDQEVKELKQMMREVLNEYL